MPNQPRAVAFDVDPASLLSLRKAFPDWEIEAVEGAIALSLTQDWGVTGSAAKQLRSSAPPQAKKKPAWRNTEGFGHVGLLFNEPADTESG
jgi:hypothetical protein